MRDMLINKANDDITILTEIQHSPFVLKNTAFVVITTKVRNATNNNEA